MNKSQIWRKAFFGIILIIWMSGFLDWQSLFSGFQRHLQHFFKFNSHLSSLMVIISYNWLFYSINWALYIIDTSSAQTWTPTKSISYSTNGSLLEQYKKIISLFAKLKFEQKILQKSEKIEKFENNYLSLWTLICHN